MKISTVTITIMLLRFAGNSAVTLVVFPEEAVEFSDVFSTKRGEIHMMLKTASAACVTRSLKISPRYLRQNSLKFIIKGFLS